jgi:hypothetical protein
MMGKGLCFWNSSHYASPRDMLAMNLEFAGTSTAPENPRGRAAAENFPEDQVFSLLIG